MLVGHFPVSTGYINEDIYFNSCLLYQKYILTFRPKSEEGMIQAVGNIKQIKQPWIIRTWVGPLCLGTHWAVLQHRTHSQKSMQIY